MVWVGLLACVLVLAGCASDGPHGSSMPSPTGTQVSNDRLQAELDSWVAGPDGVGVTAALATPTGQWSGAVGVDGAGVPLVPAAAMGIGPITSAFTAAQVMLLADRQQVDLNAPVDDYVDVPFDTNRATVRDLLSMRSGFPNDPASGIFEAASADMDQVLTSADWYDLVNPEDPRDSERGQTSSFNGLNFIVLGDLIETVTGEPFAAVLRRDLLAPAGLARAWIQAAEEPTAPTAVGVDDPEFPLVDADGPWLPSRALGSGTGSAGGMAADAPTLASWGLALYTGQLLDPDVVAQMTTSPDDSWYGLGTMIKTDSTGATMVGHDGNQGHVYTSTLLVWPDDNIAVAVLSPQGPTKPLDALAQRLHSTWVDEHPQ